MGLFEFSGLKLDLEELLGRKVDLVSYRGIHPALKRRILIEQVPLYEKNLNVYLTDVLRAVADVQTYTVDVEMDVFLLIGCCRRPCCIN